jgi:hypothetical protein
MTPLLQMRGIVRCFGAVRANDGIDFDVSAGRIVGLLGENGSGKSTLMKLLFGMLKPDAGSIVLKGRELSGHHPAEAMAAGLAMIHQHFMLIEARTSCSAGPKPGACCAAPKCPPACARPAPASASTSTPTPVSPCFRWAGASASRFSRPSCAAPTC